MRVRFGLALVGSILLHAFLLGLVPPTGGGSGKLLPDQSRLQVRVLPQPEASSAAPRTEIEEKGRAQAPQNAAQISSKISPRMPQTASGVQPALAASIATPTGEPATTQASAGNPSSPLAAPHSERSPERNNEPRSPASPLNLSIPTAQLPPRTALQTTIEQQSIRPDTVVLKFQKAMQSQAPLTTEITQTVDASGNATVKVRTPSGTYCLRNTAPPGATLYELKVLAGNCP